MTGRRTDPYPNTLDSVHLVVRGRLWRLSNPDLDPQGRECIVNGLMAARRAVCSVRFDPNALAGIRGRVDAAKRALGERGPVWWSDGEPDYNRQMVRDTPYAEWFASLKRNTA